MKNINFLFAVVGLITLFAFVIWLNIAIRRDINYGFIYKPLVMEEIKPLQDQITKLKLDIYAVNIANDSLKQRVSLLESQIKTNR